MSEDFPRTMTVKIDRSMQEDRLIQERDELTAKLALAQKENEEVKAELEKVKPRAKGTVPINPSEEPTNEQKKPYDNFGAMYNDLRAMEAAGSADAKRHLDNFVGKMLNEAKQGQPLTVGINGQIDDFTEGKSLAELMNENFRSTLLARKRGVKSAD